MEGRATNSDPFVYASAFHTHTHKHIHQTAQFISFDTFAALSITFPQLCPESSQYATLLLAAWPEHPLSPPIQKLPACRFEVCICLLTWPVTLVKVIAG